jgi:hypothetical protein
MEKRFKQEYRATADRKVKEAEAARANAAAKPSANTNDRGAPPPVADRRKVVKPDTTFNPDDIDPTRLLEGNSTISGLTCGRGPKHEVLPAPNQTIFLFPYTPYVQEAISLLDDNRNNLDSVNVVIDQRAFVARIEGTTNSEGKFQFTRIKPGRYLLMAPFSGSLTYAENRNVGGASNGYTTYQFWKTEDVTRTSTAFLQADITVDKDGDTVDGVVVKPIGRLIPTLDIVCKMHLN